MSSLPAIISLVEALLKLAPEVISIIEGFVGHGNSIPADKMPQLLSQLADVTKNPIASEVIVRASEDPVPSLQSSESHSVAS